MRNCILVFFLMVQMISFGQSSNRKGGTFEKGKFYIYWGWNHSAYSKSDIHFKGSEYDFTLFDVVAKDRQSPFDLKLYFHPATITIPQYNLRFGYFISDKYSISIGEDHMKYVMVNNQTTKIDGEISNSNTVYDGSYSNADFEIKPDFLMFEHTDGLNYTNIEFRRHDEIFKYKKIDFNLSEGVGAGMLLPRTNTTLMNNERYDQFHLSGFGLDAVVALNIEFFNRFFIQTEFKAGFINMPSIRTTINPSDKASQHFYFLQSNVVFGYNFNFKKQPTRSTSETSRN